MLNRRYGFKKIVAGVMTATVVLTSVPAVSLVIPAADFGVMEVYAAGQGFVNNSADLLLGEKTGDNAADEKNFAEKITSNNLAADTEYIISSDTQGIGVADFSMSAATLTTKSTGVNVKNESNAITFSASDTTASGSFTVDSTSGDITYRITAKKLGTQTYTLKTAGGQVIETLTVTVKGRDVLVPDLKVTTGETAKDAVGTGSSLTANSDSKYELTSGSKILVTAPAAADTIKSDGTKCAAGDIASYSFASSDAAAVKVVDVDAEHGKAIITADDLADAKLTVKAMNANGDVLSTGEITLTVKQSAAGNITSVTFAEDESKTELKGTNVNMDTVLNTTRTLKVEAKGAVTYESSNPSAVSVSAQGVVKAVNKGNATIRVKAAETSKFKDETAEFTVAVSNEAEDKLTIKNAAGDELTEVALDVESSTAANAIKTVTISAESAASNNSFKWKLCTKADGTDPIADTGNGFVKLKANGATAVIEAADAVKMSDLYVAVTTEAKNTSSGTIKAATKVIPVKVYADAEDVIEQADVTLDLEKNKSTVISPRSRYIETPEYTYTLATGGSDIVGMSQNKNEATLTAKKAGETYLTITQKAVTSGTEKRRETKKTVKITVSDDATAITAEDVTLVFGDTAKVTANTNDGTPVSFKVKEGYEEYLDVDAATGAITAKKVGKAPVVITAGKASKEINVTIAKRELTALDVSFKLSNKTYTAATKKPVITVVANDMPLVLNDDYTVSGTTSAKNAGTYKFTVKGIGNYSGTVTCQYTISKAATTFAKTSSYTKKATVAKSYNLISKGDKNTTVKMTVTGGKKASYKKFSVTKAGVLKIAKGAKKGTYKVKINVAAGKNYKAGSKTFKFIIK